MSAPSPILSFGSTDLELLETPRIRRRSDGLDEGDFTFRAPLENSLTPGMGVPSYGNLIITEGRGSYLASHWELDVKAVGLRDGAARLIDSESEDTKSGFDTGSATWADTAGKGSTYNIGKPFPGYPNLRCIGAKEKELQVGSYSHYVCAFEGIRSGTKPDHFSVQTLTRELLKENHMILMNGGDNNYPHTWNMLLAQPVLTREYLSLTRPNASIVGAQGSGAGAGSNMPQGQKFNFSNVELTWQWPNGVTLIGLDWDEIPGTTICAVREIYQDREKIIPA